MGLDKTVNTLSRAYNEIIEEELNKFLDYEQIEFDSQDFEIIEKNKFANMTMCSEIHYKNILVVKVKQKPKLDGTFEFEAIRYYIDDNETD